MSRLEEIKGIVSTWKTTLQDNAYADVTDEEVPLFDWLIQQAERVEELVEHVKALESSLNQETSHNRYLHKKNRRYKQALENLRKHAMTYSPEREDDGSIIEDHTMRFIYEETTQALGIGMNNKERNE